MARHARIEDGRFRVGKASYALVIVPPSLTWSSQTMELLQDFADADGEILFVGETPALVDGMKTDGMRGLLRLPNVATCPNGVDDVRMALDKSLEWDVNVTDDKGDEIADIYCHHRQEESRHIYFLSNKSRDCTHEGTISLRTAGQVTEWSPVDGSLTDVPANVVDERVEFSAEFPPVGSHTYVVERGKPRPPEEQPAVQRERMDLDGPWQFRRIHPNSMPLDYCQYAISGGAYGERVPMWRARKAIRDELGLGAFDDMQPWLIRKQGFEVEGEPRVSLRVEFDVVTVPSDLALVLEQADRWRISVNGQFIPATGDERHWDRQFGKVPIVQEVRSGLNQIELSTTFARDTEIEDVYLVGGFATATDDNERFRLVPEPEALENGDWVPQGYHFYAGNMVYSRTVDLPKPSGARVKVVLGSPRGSLFRVSLNGSDPRIVAWQPWEVDVTEAAHEGENLLEIEVLGTLRNTMGPLHHKDGDNLPWTGPGQFSDEDNWTDEYQFAPYGLVEGAAIVIEKEAQ